MCPRLTRPDYLRDVPDDAQGGDPKAWLAGVFDRAAPTYDRVGDAYHDYFGERLVDRAGVAEGDAVLDVACGRGAALLPAAKRVGAGGRAAGRRPLTRDGRARWPGAR